MYLVFSVAMTFERDVWCRIDFFFKNREYTNNTLRICQNFLYNFEEFTPGVAKLTRSGLIIF